jgi:hypothetical protein
MKRKFRMLMSFLSKLKKDKISVIWNNYDGNTEWQWPFGVEIQSLPKNIVNLITDILESIEDQINDIDCWSESDYYNVIADIYPKDKKIVVSMKAEEYTSQAETYERKLKNPELEDYFKTTGVEIIEARYSGGGDSGDIDSVTVDGESSNITWHSDSDDNKLIWNTLYDNLENAYGGWEIDDGSVGTIELNNNLEIVISHEWNMREMVDCHDTIEIKEDDLEE